MWNGPNIVVYKRYMRCWDRPQMNYYKLFCPFDVFQGFSIYNNLFTLFDK